MNILIVQTSFIGDTILSTPVIQGLKKIHPRSELTIMTTPAGSQIFKHDPRINRIIVFDKRGKEKGVSGLLKKSRALKAMHFDMVYSLHKSFRTSLLLFLAKIPHRIGFSDATLSFLYTKTIRRSIGRHSVISNLSILFDDICESDLNTELRLYEPGFEELSTIAQQKLALISSRYAVLAPGSAWKTKQWHADGFLKTAQTLVDKGFDVVLIGGKNDKEACEQISERSGLIDLSGEVSLSDTMHVVKNCCLLVCNDSMALHMGSAFKSPSVAIFCATSPLFGFGPWENPNAIIVEDESLTCKPCRRHGSMACPEMTNACMNLSSEPVIQACLTLLE